MVAGTYAHIFHMTKILNSTEVNVSISNISNSGMQEGGSELHSWLPIVLIISGAFFCHMGIRVLPWILTGEIFPNETRAIASGVAATSFYIFGFICNKTFLSLVSAITLPGTFWFYCSMSVIGLIVLYFVLPETEGKSLQDITDHFAGKLKLGNDVYKRSQSNSGANNLAFDNGFYKSSKIESRL
ncbi:hypothetical protein WA026_008096 [Henosepilachna vigintioctopunctata]|uniref:Major facilitator superfamily (MFS) profile domain-containing protein n=1 Tax=Henosepilachna vigintioctopunctata TaxID=420089 RepID=A0AAW1TQA3_9CUCU